MEDIVEKYLNLLKKQKTLYKIKSQFNVEINKTVDHFFDIANKNSISELSENNKVQKIVKVSNFYYPQIYLILKNKNEYLLYHIKQKHIINEDELKRYFLNEIAYEDDILVSNIVVKDYKLISESINEKLYEYTVLEIKPNIKIDIDRDYEVKISEHIKNFSVLQKTSYIHKELTHINNELEKLEKIILKSNLQHSSISIIKQEKSQIKYRNNKENIHIFKTLENIVNNNKISPKIEKKINKRLLLGIYDTLEEVKLKIDSTMKKLNDFKLVDEISYYDMEN